MAQKWSAFTDGSPIVTTDLVVGLRAGANRRFDGSGILLAAQNLADVGTANTAFNNISPVTTKGDIIYRNATVNARLGIGTNNQILAVSTDVPAWINNPGLLIAQDLADVNDANTSFNNISPVTTKGDIIYRNATVNARLGIGADTEILSVATDVPAWIANPGLLIAQDLADVNDANTSFNNISPVTTKGDIIYRNATVNARLPIGTDGYFLTVATDVPSWVAFPGLLPANDLADVDSVPTALTNLGLSSADDVTFNSVEVGRTNAITAFAGGGQGSATALTKQFNRVTTVGTAGDSVKLPASLAGNMVVVTNAAAANAMDVFPVTGEVINALSANTAISVAANKTMIFFCMVDGIWNSVLTA